MVLTGRVWKFGTNINTDIIYPGKFLKITDPTQMASYAFASIYPDFHKSVTPGDIIVAGRNFGCGSSREQAVLCLKHLGIGAIVAESIARIYYRNAINVGLPAIICPNITAHVNNGDILELYLESGQLLNKSTGVKLQFTPLPPFILNIIRSGGLIPYLRTCNPSRR